MTEDAAWRLECLGTSELVPQGKANGKIVATSIVSFLLRKLGVKMIKFAAAQIFGWRWRKGQHQSIPSSNIW
ncbi:unnamed protein product [Chondrus crispus]|uniref:Uncharacterized protein n=1 Tax=Chondrus crispus TaxID=2769 RepID=R7Q5M9_CHOCR|nr:unnamed protein product [Chondrus crispus]CDF33138.1 unnamed protein product [Chondrus crispus]|eukprot:XP_005712941.1 unnamed protein product [Chondrus crispus]